MMDVLAKNNFSSSDSSAYLPYACKFMFLLIDFGSKSPRNTLKCARMCLNGQSFIPAEQTMAGWSEEGVASLKYFVVRISQPQAIGRACAACSV